MLENFLNTDLFRNRKVQGVNVCLGNNQELTIDYVLLEKNKSTINLVKWSDEIQGLNKAYEQLNNKYPVYLSIIGNGIVHRTIKQPDIQSLSHTNIIKSIFPNVKSEDFFIQKTSINGGMFVSVIRKEIVKKVLIDLNKKGFFIFGVTIGPSVLEIIADIQPSITLKCKNYELVIDNNKVDSINLIKETPEQFYQIGDENINNNILISFSSALQYFTKPVINEIILDEAVHERKEFIYKKAGYFLKWGLLLVSFLILLINYIFYEHYKTKYNQLSAKYNAGIEQVNRLKKLSENYKIRSLFVQENDLLKSSKLSFYTDRLIVIMPKKITLNNLLLSPLKENIRKNTHLAFKQEQIIVLGETEENNYLNQWIKEIENENWVKDVEIISFEHQEKTLTSQFKIKIIVNN